MTRNSNSVTQTDWLKATVFSVPRHFWSKETGARNHIKLTKPLISVRQIESKQKNLKTREFFWKVENRFLQVNLFQKLSFLHHLTHNMTRDCSLNYIQEKYKFRKCCVQKIVFLFLFWHSKQYLYTTCSELVFFGEFNE